MPLDPMKLAERAVEAALAAGCDYADARANRLEREELGMRNDELRTADALEDFGLGVRVRKNGTWGFAASPLSTRDEALADTLGRRAASVAGALASARRDPVELAPLDARAGEYATPYETDPFAVPLADKVGLLREACERMRGARATVVREATFSGRREEQWQASSDGARIHQRLLRTGAGIHSAAALGGRNECRSYPNSFGGNYQSAGFEFVLGLDLVGHAERVRDEAVALCEADLCPPGVRDLVLMPSQLALQIHESVGHPNELDRVFGHEVDLAGSSFATTEKLGTFRYGSDAVSLVADSTLPRGLDTRGFDDDGVPSTAWHVVERGVFAGYHTDREWAPRLSAAGSRATSRAEGWFAPPILRMTNISLEPGTWTLDDLVADTEDGVLADTVKTWSIDQRRLNFQFTTEIGWEIREGRLGRMLCRPTYQGSTPTFWGSCDAVCGPAHFELHGVQNCGKGNPLQIAEMSHGSAPARFRGVTFL